MIVSARPRAGNNFLRSFLRHPSIGVCSMAHPVVVGASKGATTEHGEHATASSIMQCLKSWKNGSAILATFADYLGLSMLTPIVPFMLSDQGRSDSNASMWMGVIMSAQFGGLVIGNFVWGTLGDRFGSQRVLGITMAGDVLFFALTAAVKNPVPLVIVRVFAGFSTPLVPGLLYILDRATTPVESVKGEQRLAPCGVLLP